VACDPVPAAGESFLAKVPGAKLAPTNADVLRAADVIVLAVKPQSMAAVMNELAAQSAAGKLFVSIAAGVTLAKLEAGLKTGRVIRVMPNTPALVGQGASAYALGSTASADDGKLVGQLLAAVGQAHQVEEKLLDAVTGLSGSGPAFVYLVIEALTDGGVRTASRFPGQCRMRLQTPWCQQTSLWRCDSQNIRHRGPYRTRSRFQLCLVRQVRPKH
jgi:pyrroline-5-carboxylate reductase